METTISSLEGHLSQRESQPPPKYESSSQPESSSTPLSIGRPDSSTGSRTGASEGYQYGSTTPQSVLQFQETNHQGGMELLDHSTNVGMPSQVLNPASRGSFVQSLSGLYTNLHGLATENAALQASSQYDVPTAPIGNEVHNLDGMYYTNGVSAATVYPHDELSWYQYTQMLGTGIEAQDYQPGSALPQFNRHVEKSGDCHALDGSANFAPAPADMNSGPSQTWPLLLLSPQAD